MMLYHAHPVILLELAKARCSDRLKEVEIGRLSRKTRVGKPGLLESLLLSMGDFLVWVGSKLKERYEPAAYPGIRLDSSLEKALSRSTTWGR